MRLIQLAFGCLLVAVAGGIVNADAIYKWRDENGKIHFGDKPPVSGESTPVTVKPNVYHAPPIEGKTGAGYRREKVVMYSTKRCGYCKKARAYFKRNAIPYVEYDVETSRKGKLDYKKLGGKGVPIILVGKRRLNGFSEAGFSEIYQSSID
ncbi:MAG: glutaredoxin family protein [Candidatus Thiodiazotropha sp. (ex. Lucinisca nassula)]|nr:glutaredoxin family protein [Candidatus Thiodiazotropha sp. (ex. Lucinisca nassula)]MBW9274507.1 glutaredoxin family protein [Candidatus Thiodiazotropha sp. (ex. Lucinisca nassula)]